MSKIIHHKVLIFLYCISHGSHDYYLEPIENGYLILQSCVSSQCCRFLALTAWHHQATVWQTALTANVSNWRVIVLWTIKTAQKLTKIELKGQ